MTLISNVQSRIPSGRLIELTNDDTSDTTVNATVLGLAADDIEAMFQILGVGTYDDTDARHVAEAVPGVVLLLRLWKGQATDEDFENWKKNVMDKLRKVTGNNRISPKSSSKETPADEAPDGQEIRPDFDIHSSFDQYTPGQHSSDQDFLDAL